MSDWGPLAEFADESEAQTTEEAPVQHEYNTAIAEQPTEVVDAAMPAQDADVVTCPECGTKASVTLNRRQAEDFCRTCDFPLFWTPTEVVLDRGGLTDESLRRLPGTTGRARTASVACPHCAELNQVNAIVCVRCGRSMRVEAPPPPPPPAPVYVPPPPVFLPPPKQTPWWAWLLLGITVAAIVTLIVLFATGTI